MTALFSGLPVDNPQAEVPYWDRETCTLQASD